MERNLEDMEINKNDPSLLEEGFKAVETIARISKMDKRLMDNMLKICLGTLTCKEKWDLLKFITKEYGPIWGECCKKHLGLDGDEGEKEEISVNLIDLSSSSCSGSEPYSESSGSPQFVSFEESPPFEDEEALVGFLVKLYRFNSVTKDWKEKGEGVIRLLQSKSGKFRIVMWRLGTQTLACNFAIFPNFKVMELQGSKKDLIWSCFDISVEPPEWVTFACRFSSQRNAQQFQLKVLECSYQMNKLHTPAALRHSFLQQTQNDHRSSDEEESFYDADLVTPSLCGGCIGCDDDFQFPDLEPPSEEGLIELVLDQESSQDLPQVITPIQ